MNPQLKKWSKEHLFGLSLGASLLIQVLFLFLVYFRTDGGDLDKKFLPMTIRPFQELMQQVEQEVVKEVVEADDKEALDEEKEESSKPKVAQNTFDPGSFMPFVRVDEIAKPKDSLMPDYPQLARSAGVEGTVVLEVYIDEEGRVRKVRVVRGIGFGTDEAAIRKVQNTRFEPAKLGANPVAVRQIITFDFKLQ